MLLWFLMCIVIAIQANKKNRSWLGYLVLSAVLSPLVGIVVLLIAGEKS